MKGIKKGKAADVWHAEAMQPHSDTAFLVSVSRSNMAREIPSADVRWATCVYECV